MLKEQVDDINMLGVLFNVQDAPVLKLKPLQQQVGADGHFAGMECQFDLLVMLLTLLAKPIYLIR